MLPERDLHPAVDSAHAGLPLVAPRLCKIISLVRGGHSLFPFVQSLFALITKNHRTVALLSDPLLATVLLIFPASPSHFSALI